MKNRDLAASVRLGIAGGEKGKGKEVIEAILFLLCLKIERVKSLEFEEASKRDNIENKCSLINKVYAKLMAWSSSSHFYLAGWFLSI